MSESGKLERSIPRRESSENGTRFNVAVIIATFLIVLAGDGLATARETVPPVQVSPAQEVAWGRKALAEFLLTHAVSRDGNLILRADEVGRRVARFSDRPHLQSRVLVIQGDEPQAYSFPGGTICLTEGAAKLYPSDDELAFALGHELAHIVLRHHVTQLRVSRALRSGTPGETALLRSVQSALDRDAETEADRFGALYAVRAGYSFTRAVEALARLGVATPGPEKDDAHGAFDQRVEALVAFRADLEKSLEAFERGLVELKQGRPDEAIILFNLFVGEFPNSVSGHVNLGAAYLALVRMTAGPPEGLSEVLPTLPDPGVVLRGGVDTRDLNQALAIFDHAVRLQPDEVLALAGLGLVHARLHQFEEARKYLDAALAIEGDRPELVLCRGNVEYMAREFTKAIPLYLRALELRHDWPQARRNLALTYERSRMFEAARAAWTLLLDHEDYRHEALQYLRNLEAESGS